MSHRERIENVPADLTGFIMVEVDFFGGCSLNAARSDLEDYARQIMTALGDRQKAPSGYPVHIVDVTTSIEPPLH